MQPRFPLQIVSKKLIKPATPTLHNLRKLNISSLDQRQPPIHVSFVFFYPASDKDGRAKSAERSKQLQLSLSEVLTLFYPLAGRYIQDHLLIDCNDDGVEYVEAKVASHLTSVLKVDNKQLVPLIPQQCESSTSPLVAVQCNMFQCGGLAIGLCISHRIVDGFVFAKFVDGWATACRVGSDKVHPLSFDLAELLPTKEIKPLPPLIPRPNVATKTFVFSGVALSNLREIAEVGGVKDSLKLGSRASRVQLVTALIWKALIRVDQTKHEELRPSIIAHLINMRGRTVLPISDNCCGSLARPAIVRYTPGKNSNNVEFHELVSLVCDAFKNAVTDCAKPQNGNEFFMMVDKAWKEFRKVAKKCNTEERDDAEVQTEPYFFASTSGMPFYPDFGWGKPSKVTRVQTFPEILIQLMDTRDGDGIEAFICLDENEMSLFQQDPDIIAFTSQAEQHDPQSTIRLRSKF